MRKNGSTKTKFTVIIGYVLVIAVMAIGLIALYNNLVDYSNKRIDNQDLSELLIVSNTLSLLYEIESEQNLFTAENADRYFQIYDSIAPIINENLNELKMAATDTLRVVKLDSIGILVEMKKENLKEMAILLDSLRQSPRITRETESSYVPRELNREISDYLESRDLHAASKSQSDTSVVAGQRKGFLDRVRNVFDGRPDSTIVIESRSVVADNEFKLIVDTIINKVRYSERLDLERQRHFQHAFFKRQELISSTNRMLTARIDDLLKEIEQEEMAKSVQLLVEKEKALTRSQNTMHLASVAAIAIAILFGVLFLIDINRSQRYRKQLEASNRRISELLAARERLMLTISHDIKAPVSSILGYLELMSGDVLKGKSNERAITVEDDGQEGNEQEGNGHSEQQKVEEYLSNMEQSGQHVLQLVSRLLDFHKLESGAWQMKHSNVNLRDLVNETALSFKPLADGKGLEYHVDNGLPESEVRYIDPYVMRQVMSNLISNAIKYTAKGSVSIEAREVAADGYSRLQFNVIDTGPGIELEDREVIFQDFKQLENSGDPLKRVDGSGLGLAITKGFVEALNGDIRLESEKGTGSRFTIDVPLEFARDEELLANDTLLADEELLTVDEHDPWEGAVSELLVLVVDDDPVQLKMTHEVLARANIRGITEQYPERVLQRLKEKSFDILLMDLQMPGTDGIELVERIRDADVEGIDELPIIALSARSDISEKELKKRGFTGFLIKPFTSKQLYGIIYRYAGEGGSPVGGSPQAAENDVRENNTPLARKVDGVKALIDFVKEDKNASLGILQSYETETSKNRDLLKSALAENDAEGCSEIAHTILPLARMMNDELLTSLLDRLEKKEALNAREEQSLMDRLEEKIKEARGVIEELHGRDAEH